MRNDSFQRTVSKFENRQREVRQLLRFFSALTHRFAATQVNEGLDQIFVKLKKKNINPALLGASGNRTLYDFVDNASIERLQKQTTKEINQMKVRSHHNVPSH